MNDLTESNQDNTILRHPGQTDIAHTVTTNRTDPSSHHHISSADRTFGSTFYLDNIPSHILKQHTLLLPSICVSRNSSGTCAATAPCPTSDNAQSLLLTRPIQTANSRPSDRYSPTRTAMLVIEFFGTWRY